MLVLFFIFFLPKYITLSSSCSTLRPFSPYTHSHIHSCLTSLPYSPTLSSQTLSSLKSIFRSYVYKDININSSNTDYTIVNDVMYRIEEVLEKKEDYGSDFEFHEMVMDVFSKNYDPHTVYIMPFCYATMVYYLPFPVRLKERKVYVGVHNDEQVVLEKYEELFPERADLYHNMYYGYEIVKINGRDVMEVLVEYADEKCYYSRDHSIRFNQVLKEEWHRRILARSEEPKEATIHYTLRDSEGQETEVDVDWMVIPALDYRFEPLEKICKYTMDEDVRKHLELHDEKGVNVYHIDNYYKNKFNSLGLKKKKRKNVKEVNSYFYTEFDEIELNYNDFSYFELYQKENTDIGYFKVKTFMPNISVSADLIVYAYQYYYLSLNDAFVQMKERGINRLIVDVRGNVGGIACLGAILIQYLSKYAPLDCSPNAEMTYTDYGKDMHCSNNFVDQISFFTTKRKPVRGTKWYTDGPYRERGGRVSKYTQLVHFGCEVTNLMSFTDKLWETNKKYFEPENLIVLSDGTCGSTCGIFIKGIQYHKLGRVVTQGGIEGKDMEPCSFKGAAVKTLNGTIQELFTYSYFCDISNVDLKPFPSSAMFSYSWLMLYPWDPIISTYELDRVNTEIPFGFMRKKADFHIYDWDFTDDVVEKVLPYFEECASWEVKRNDAGCKYMKPFKYAVVGNPCVGGVFDETKCVLRGCDQGKYLSFDGKKCLNMPREYDILSDIQGLIIGVILDVFLFFCFMCFCYFFCSLCCMGITCKCLKKENVIDIDDHHEGNRISMVVQENTNQTETIGDVKYQPLPEEEEEEEDLNILNTQINIQ